MSSFSPAARFWYNRANPGTGAYFNGVAPRLETDPAGLYNNANALRRAALRAPRRPRRSVLRLCLGPTSLA